MSRLELRVSSRLTQYKAHWFEKGLSSRLKSRHSSRLTHVFGFGEKPGSLELT